MGLSLYFLTWVSFEKNFEWAFQNDVKLGADVTSFKDCLSLRKLFQLEALQNVNEKPRRKSLFFEKL